MMRIYVYPGWSLALLSVAHISITCMYGVTKLVLRLLDENSGMDLH